jgi:hypothetical protein
LAVLAGLQLLLGYEWLVSGVDKLLYGTFPQTLGTLLKGTLSNPKVPAFFVALLRDLVLPNAALFGAFIMWAETLAGLGLIAAGLVALLRPWLTRQLTGTLASAFIGQLMLRQSERGIHGSRR